ncbi:MAG: hypothetical protein GVY11_05415 [Gammaproteobacteria bacterium]|jgi:hypothetical protein|nr:hypothetical protein [Gammaproteobacteria bacterium]
MRTVSTLGFQASMVVVALLVLLPASQRVAAALPAAEATPCPMPKAGAAGNDHGRPAVRRLRAAVGAGVGDTDVESDLADLTFATAAWPRPLVRRIEQSPLRDRTRLALEVVNNSRHVSPDGGMTVSFPDLDRPSDRSRVGNVVVPEGMALHVIPAGGRLFGQNGLARTAEHLMIEVHGVWRPRQVRRLEIDILAVGAPLVVRYRSALSDDSGDYRNTPADSDTLDQQGWPAHTCLMGVPDSSLAERGRTSGEAGGQP